MKKEGTSKTLLPESVASLPGIQDAYERKTIVVMAGAGVSAGPPSSLPGWKPLNAAFVRALRQRLESDLNGRVSLTDAESLLDAAREGNRFPPEYQAQVIEEMCGDRYFRGLQSLDVTVGNAAHESIAALAKDGVLRAIVTTNFDCLIERALDRQGIACDPVFDDAGFLKMSDRLSRNGSGPLPVVKVHGSVSSHLSMIDTLKQRNLSRAKSLQSCLDALYPNFWLYLGFSAADLEGNPNYLGMIAGAARSEGAVFVAFRTPDLGPGAKSLMTAYADRGQVVVDDISAYISSLRNSPKAAIPAAPHGSESGLVEFHSRLETWAGTLSLSSVGLCLAAILEANGQSETSVRLMDRLVRKEIYDERDTADFRLLQLHYGRLGAAYGRFIAVPDINGVISNASVETEQSLMRVLRTDLGFAASSWLGCWFLWSNDGANATGNALRVLQSFVDGKWLPPMPRNDEEAVDAWLAAAQAMVLNTHPEAIAVVSATVEAAIARARQCGDTIRAARANALHLLAMAETMENVPKLAERYQADFHEADRVGDGVALGFFKLALGRWHAGAGGIALATETNDKEGVARRALDYLNGAIGHFQSQGMDPWVLFGLIQAAKAYSDLGAYGETHKCFENANTFLPRFPIMRSHHFEAIAQIEAARNDPDADQIYLNALSAAEESGLMARHQILEKIYSLYRRRIVPTQASADKESELDAKI